MILHWVETVVFKLLNVIEVSKVLNPMLGNESHKIGFCTIDNIWP
jgi:hypothetical protein